MKKSLLSNSKLFWSFVKSMTKQNSAPTFLRDGQRFVSNHTDLLNCFFQSAFTANDGTIDSPWRLLLYSPTTQANLFYHQTEVAKVLNDIDPAKAPGPDNISGRLLKETAPENSFSLSAVCSTFRCHWVNSQFRGNWQMFVLFSKKMTQR